MTAKFLPTLSALVLATSSALSGPAFAQGDQPAQEEKPTVQRGLAHDLQDTFASIADKVYPSVVTIAAYRKMTAEELAEAKAVEAGAELSPKALWIKQLDREYPGFVRIGSGSGVVMNEEGDILTNRHFLLKEDGTPADLVDVETWDFRHTISRVVGMEPTLNMAVVQLEVYSPNNPPRFTPITMGNSGTLLPGHWAIAIGDPFGPERFFRPGVLASSPSRECYQEQLSAAYLQVAVQAHPGSYGGALVNIDGEFVGMLSPREPELGSMAMSNMGIEFALPSNIIQGLYRTIKKNESFQSPWLGIAVMGTGELRKELGTDGFRELDRPRVGIFIENVFDPSPAFGAGIQPGDFLTKLNGYLIGGPLDFQKQLYLSGLNSVATCEFYRAGETFTRELEVKVRPANAITR